MTRFILGLLLAVVALSAAVLSFAALRDLALACGFDARLAWLLPVVVDAGAAAGTLTWLSGDGGRARAFGKTLALSLLGSSVVGNAVAHALDAYRLAAPWWVVVIVSAIAPGVLGAVIHLAFLVSQPAGTPAEETTVRHTVYTAEPASGADWDDRDDDRDEPVPDRATELIAAGVGRRRLARELDISEYEARQLLARNGVEETSG